MALLLSAVRYVHGERAVDADHGRIAIIPVAWVHQQPMRQRRSPRLPLDAQGVRASNVWKHRQRKGKIKIQQVKWVALIYPASKGAQSWLMLSRYSNRPPNHCRMLRVTMAAREEVRNRWR